MLQSSVPINQNSFYRRWLIIICAMIIVMIALGGITRLTQSGLSMSSWKFYGNLPPMNDTEWEAEFNRYKTTPEFQLINSKFSATDFKSIYWWEYIHRMTGRSIGIFYILPLLYFAFRNRINRNLIVKHIAGFALIVSQGLLGWIMVKSGLKSKPHVDHYLLAAHFSLAMFTLLYHVNLFYNSSVRRPVTSPITKTARFTLVVASLQLILGALVAGTKGGLVYNTFPRMGIHWIPPEVLNNEMATMLYNGAALQFFHRTIALLMLVSIAFLISRVFRLSPVSKLRNTSVALTAIVTIQVATGISCLLFGVPVLIGVIHQVGGVFVVLTIHRIMKLSSAISDATNSVEQHAQADAPASDNHNQSVPERSHVGFIE